MIDKSELGDVARSVLKRFEETKIDPSWSFAECGRKETNKWTHGYHRYPAKFIPQIVERLFDEYITEDNAHINDPFYGSGTTIVSAIARGYRASGTDINGIAYLMTQVKAAPIDPAVLEERVEHFLKRNSEDKNGNHIIPEHHLDRIDYWFHEEAKLELGRILHIISSEENEQIRNFLVVGFSHILKSCSIWLQTSTKPTRDMNKIQKDPNRLLRSHLKRMIKGNNAFYRIVPLKVKNALDDYLHISLGDARSQPCKDRSVDLIVSSSPYLTSYEYASLHQLSTIWLDFTKNMKEYQAKFIGSILRPKIHDSLKSDIAMNIISQMRDNNQKLSQEIESFFVDMQQIFEEANRILKPGGKCCFVIGNTSLKGIEILNAQIFAEILHHTGFSLDRIIKREIPTKILPQTRDAVTGRFASSREATAIVYPVEYIVIGGK